MALVAGRGAPELLWRGEIALVDPAAPETAEPYHYVMELPWEQAVVAVQPLVARIESAARKAIAAIVRQLATKAAATAAWLTLAAF